MEANILEITSLTKSYGGIPAINGLTFTVPSGKIVGILGPNGSGKTTLIKSIMGLLSGYTGEIKINGEPPGASANAQISYLPDICHIPAWFTTAQAIQFFADFYQDFDKPRAESMLESMKIPHGKRIKTLSRGMMEKMQLALVMSRRAKLYILDEPIGAVDPAAREFIMDTILRHFPENSSILLTTHIIADIEPILDHAIFLNEGEIVINSEADQIRAEKNISLDQLFREMFREVL